MHNITPGDHVEIISHMMYGTVQRIIPGWFGRYTVEVFCTNGMMMHCHPDNLRLVTPYYYYIDTN